MVIRLDENYNAMTSTALLGYVGETNARPVSVEGMEIDGADRYVLSIDYGDGTVYEVDITGGQWTPTADILRSAQTVSCQICAKKLSGQEYILVKKSRIFRLRIGAAIGDTAIPSPDVAMDALDRIDAIGRQTHADMQTAVTAAETATMSAENAKKSATAAGLSADTATQAAERAETAQASAETSATQADTAMQGAETARQQAVTQANAAKVSAVQASTAAQQTEADKTITAGYAKTAKTCADSTATDRQAVQDMATQVTADKTTVADHATQVATDRKAAETAAQTAQAVADSLPEDYTTAVGKIAENTAEIASVKLSDKELQRRVNALYDIGQGITHQFETDSDTAYVKTIPTGAKLMSVKNIGGRSIVWNQLCDTVLDNFSDTVSAVYHEYGICKFTANVGDKICIYSGGINGTYAANGAYVAGFIGSAYIEFFGKQIVQCTENGNCIIYLRLRGGGSTYSNVSVRPEFFNLTKMFGSGNEPSTVEKFEAMFPNDYYQYNAGEIVSAGTESIIEQGKNLFDYTDKTYNGANISKVENGVIYTKGLTTTVLNIPTVVGSKYTLSFKVKSSGANQGGLRWSLQKGKNTSYAHDSSLIKSEVGYAANTEYQAVVPFVADTDFVSLCTIVGMVYDVQLENGDIATDYFPFYQTEYLIPDTIKALPGYGWSAGTARNYVDYENKKYYQCVNSVDLGTLEWLYRPEQQRFYAIADSITGKFSESFGIVPNIVVAKYDIVCFNDITTKTDNMKASAIKTANDYITIRNTAYTDATTFKQAMSGVMLYYELETPIVTDISDLLTEDFLRNVEVEAGGSVTFKNSNDNYHIPVPSEEEYIVKLSEIGGTT